MRPGVVLAAVVALVGASGATSSPALGPTPPGTAISFVVQLHLDSARLDRDLAAGRRIASSVALGRRYGLPLESVRRVERVLRAHGVSVLGGYPQRTAIDARATVAAISRLFHVRYRDFRDPSGTVYHAPTGAPEIPAALRPYVAGVVGLSTRPVALPADLPHGALMPQDAALAYDVAPLQKAGIDGTGQTIAILSLSVFPPNGKDSADDVSTFRKKFAANGPDPVDVKVSGGGNVKDVSEDDLDLDVVSAIAPGAQIVNYEAPSTAAGIVDMFGKLVADGKAGIATFSWGICDAGLPLAYRVGVTAALKLAVLRGITVFAASGDSGSYDCQRADFADHRLSVDFPASSPQAVAVGGTLLSVSSDGTYAGEAGWEQPLSYAGGGGGVNTIDPAPSWQQAAGIGDGHRGVPDVAAAASPDSGWLTRDYGKWDAAGGTSAASPFWAASMLLAEQLARKHGVSRRCFLAPILYRLASTKQRYPAFHDVRAGGNRYYSAGPGWDYATGLGSPDVWNLARDLTAFLRSHRCLPGS
jgi:kumamolisin